MFVSFLGLPFIVIQIARNEVELDTGKRVLRSFFERGIQLLSGVIKPLKDPIQRSFPQD
jgi:hypothetical protein